MSRMTRQDLWQLLTDSGVVRSPLPETEVPPPWYMRLFLGVAGWLAASTLLGFFSMALILDAEIASLVIGIALCVMGILGLRHAGHGDFIEQGAFALSASGQALVVFGIAETLHPSGEFLALTLLLIEIVFYLAVSNPFCRVLAGYTALGALMFLLKDSPLLQLVPGLFTLICTLLIAHEERLARYLAWLRPGVTAMVLVAIPLQWGGPQLRGLGMEGMLGTGSWQGWGNLLLEGVGLVYLVILLIRSEGGSLSSRNAMVIYLGVVLLSLAALKAPGILLGVLLLLLGRMVGSRFLLACGIVGTLGYLGSYYYFLHQTLLQKSLILFALGVGLLLAWWLCVSGRLLKQEDADA